MKGLSKTISGRVYTLLGARAIHGQVKCLSKGKNSLLVVVELPYPLPELSGLEGVDDNCERDQQHISISCL